MRISPVFGILASCFLHLSVTACEDGVKLAQLAQRGIKVAKSMNEEGDSKDPKLRALQVAAKNACDHIVACAEERERESGEMEEHENIDDLQILCESSKLIVVHAQLSGKRCVQALTDQFNCVANTPCDQQDDDAGACKELMQTTEKVCSEFWDGESSED